MFDKLNEILKEFTLGYEDTSEYQFIQDMVNIILSVKVPLYNQKYHSKMRFNCSKDHSFRFLSGLKSDYVDCLHFVLNNGKISFDSSKENKSRLSTVSIVNGDKHINMYLRDTVEDSYTLTHELFHYMNLDLNNVTNNWDLTTEAISITGEGLQKDYFRRLGVKDFRLNEMDTLFALKIKAIQLDFELKLIYTYLNYGVINEFLFSEILNGKSDFYFEMAYDDYLEIIRTGELNFPLLQRNVVGGCLAMHMLYRIGKDKRKIGEFITINDCCNSMSFIDTLRFLDLNVVDEDIVILDKSSIDTLQKEYIYRVKSIYN